jgi:tetratricopeptide (TPR) repeat protein
MGFIVRRIIDWGECQDWKHCKHWDEKLSMSWNAFLKEVADAYGLFEEDDRQAFLTRFADRSLHKPDAQVASELHISEVTLQRRLGRVYSIFVLSCPELNSNKRGKFRILRDWLKTVYTHYKKSGELPGLFTTNNLGIGNLLSHVLHLSDLHFGTTDNARIWYAQLAEDLRYELNCSRLDALILSGDIASKSTSEEYAAAKLFINRLCQEFQLESHQIVIVPGNHDVNWELAEEAYILTNQEDYDGELREGCYIEESASLIKLRDEEKYKQRFTHFSQFYQEIKGEDYSLEYDQQYSLQHLPEQNLLILGLNSAWQIDHYYKSRASIHPDALSNILSQIRRSSAYENCLKIAVWHHPLNSAFEDRIKDDSFIERLAVAGFRLVLHGGIHRAESSSYHYDYGTDGRQINIIGAGVFGRPTQELIPGYPWQYNLLKVESSQLTVETRRRDDLNGAWKPDDRWTQGAGLNPLSYYVIALEQDNPDVPELYIERGKAYVESGSYEEAIACYQSALQFYTSESSPQDWAEIQNNLGLAYRERIQGEKAENLEQAIASYTGALQVYTRDAFPQHWATTQNNLGTAYSNRILGDKAQNLEQAIASYTAALQVYTRDAFPQHWATTQNNLGIAYSNRILGDKAQNLEQAIASYTAALQVYTRDTFPQHWATTQNNLGAAYSHRILGDKAQNLEQAIASYSAVLAVYTREAFPYKWATTQTNLGVAYSNRIWGERADNLERAITSFNAALEIYTREAFPDEWAMTQTNLGVAYSNRIRGERADNLEQAIASFDAALEVYTREAFPEDWAMTLNNLANAYLYRIQGERADNLERAIASFDAALEVRTREAFPYDWAITQNNLAITYSSRIRGEKAENLEVAINSYQAALQVYTREAFPYEWASTNKNLGNAYMNRIHGNRLENIEIAILFYQDALEVYTQEAFPDKWASLRDSFVEAHYILEHYQRELESNSLTDSISEEDDQKRLLETALTYEALIVTSEEEATVGQQIEVSIYLRQVQGTENKVYVLQVPRSESIGSELNILLSVPGFRFDGDNTASLPLDPNIGQTTQTARFRLTALRPGSATITAELYRGDIFQTNIEAKVQVAEFDEAGLLGKLITTQPRPVPQPDFILRVQTIWNERNSACRFHYQLRSFRLPSLFPGETNYHSESLSSSWIEQMRGLLGTTLENISDALPEDGRSRLTSLGQYLFQHLLPPELQTDFRRLIPRDRTFTLLILADQDASLPWELLHDGQRFLSDRFIIGRWFWELNDTRPHEFPVGAINVAHYADVEQPELWTALLEPPGSPLPLPLPEGVLSNLDSTEAMRGLHLIRYSQSSDDANRRNAPVTLDDTNNAQDIERQMRPAKLNLRRNRPLVSLGYVRRDRLWCCPPWGNRPELTTLEQTWASAFIRAGCSAFTGSLWAVDPAVEAAFISGFYNRLWTGDSLGEAFHASRQLARAVAPDSLDWLAYVLFGDPMARPYRPVEGKGYAVVEPIGREIDDPLPSGIPVRFRLSLRRTPPVWHEERVIEVAENLTFENLQAHVKTFGLQVTPDSPITMSLAPTGNYLGWFTLVAPPEMVGNSALVQVFLMDGMLPIHSLMFSLNIENEEGSQRE